MNFGHKRIAPSRQFVEQLFRFLQIGRFKPLGKPAVHGREYFTRCGSPPLFAPEPSKANRGAQLVRLCLLRTRDAQRLTEGTFRVLDPVETQEGYTCETL